MGSPSFSLGPSFGFLVLKLMIGKKKKAQLSASDDRENSMGGAYLEILRVACGHGCEKRDQVAKLFASLGRL
jgi:hypothetical protein